MCIKSGITSIWHVDSGSDINWDKWIEMKPQYINQISLWTEFGILLGTNDTVIERTGAI